MMRIWQRISEIDGRRAFWQSASVVVFCVFAILLFRQFDDTLVRYDNISLLLTERCMAGAENRFTRVYPEHPDIPGWPGSVGGFTVSAENCSDGETLRDALAAPKTGVSALLTAERAIYIPGETYYLIDEHSDRLGTFSLPEGVPLAGDWRFLEDYTHAPAASLTLDDRDTVGWAKPPQFARNLVMSLLMSPALAVISLTPVLSYSHYIFTGALNLFSGRSDSFGDALQIAGENVLAPVLVLIAADHAASQFRMLDGVVGGDMLGNLIGVMLSVILLLMLVFIIPILMGAFAFKAGKRARPQAARIRRGALALYQKYHGDYKFAA